MAKPKKNNRQTSSSPSVKVQDLQPDKNPKGGVQKVREAAGSKISFNK